MTLQGHGMMYGNILRKISIFTELYFVQCKRTKHQGREAEKTKDNRIREY
jgi:hypothetical protein